MPLLQSMSGLQLVESAYEPQNESFTIEDEDQAAPPPVHSYIPRSRISPKICGPNWIKSLTVLELVLGFIVLVLSFMFVALFVNVGLQSKVPAESTPTTTANVCLTRSCIEVSSRIAASLDESIDPCDDFYSFSCGGWIKKNPLPMGKSQWSPFDLLMQDNDIVLKKILDDSPSSSLLSERKARWYYQSCLDMTKIDELGAMPLLKYLNQTGSWPVLSSTWNELEFDLNRTVANLLDLYLFPFFSIGVGLDAKNSSAYVIQIDENALNLGNRAYYVNKTIEKSDELTAYLDYTVDITVLLGGDRNTSVRDMTEMIRFEQSLAKHVMSIEEARDESANYRNITLKQLKEVLPNFDWDMILTRTFKKITKVDLKDDEKIVTSTLDFLQKLPDIIKKTPKRVMANYIYWRIVDPFVPRLSQPFLDAEDAYFKKRYGADPKCHERWKTCVGLVDLSLGKALGRLFVKDAFADSSKTSAMEMVQQIRKSFLSNLPSTMWMDKMTKLQARDKALAVLDMIGYPDDLLNTTYIENQYKDLHIKDNMTFFDITLEINSFSILNEFSRLKQVVNRTREWDATPPTVNAYYSPTLNVIVFPAGILQPPFYKHSYPNSINYGGIGMVIGHEFTHGFDDEGRKFDKNGNMVNWWEDETVERFNKKTECMVKQYSNYTIGKSSLSGNLTLGENIADNGGLRLAFNAYQNSNSSYDPLLPSLNYTHDQLFFLSFAQLWCGVKTPEALQQSVMNDPHSPGKYRVIGTLSNSDKFAQAFNCPVGSKMNPATKCKVW